MPKSINITSALSYAYYMHNRYYIPKTRDLRYDGFRILAIVLSNNPFLITTGGINIPVTEDTQIVDYGVTKE